MIRNFFAASAVAVLLMAHSQAALMGSLVLEQSGVAASDGLNALTVDTYMFNVENTEASAVTSIEMAFSGNFWTVTGLNAAFRNTPAMPQVFGQNVADSFFISDGTQLVGNSVDTTTTLSGAWTLPGDGTPVIESGATATMAYLVVPTGEVPTYDGGRGAVAGAFVDITTGTKVGIEAMYVGPGTSLSEGLQGAFGSRGYGPIVLNDAIMIGNIGGDLAGLDPLSATVVGAPDFATVSVTDLDGDGKYDIEIDADFASLDPGTAIGGEIVFATGAEGADPNAVGFGFSVSVPEPSTIALSGLALLGLVGFARRR